MTRSDTITADNALRIEAATWSEKRFQQEVVGVSAADELGVS